MADDTADGGAADRSDRATTRQDGPANRTDSGTNCRVLVLSRHPGASSEAEQQGSGYCRDCISLDHRFHGFASFIFASALLSDITHCHGANVALIRLRCIAVYGHALPPSVCWRTYAEFDAFGTVVRPVAVWLGLLGATVSRDQRILISWFGIRGIGSIYYLMYAITHGLPAALASEITALTLTVVAVSIVMHGMSVTPLMNLYARRAAHRRPE